MKVQLNNLTTLFIYYLVIILFFVNNLKIFYNYYIGRGARSKEPGGGKFNLFYYLLLYFVLIFIFIGLDTTNMVSYSNLFLVKHNLN
jgi:hypothetical protein